MNDPNKRLLIFVIGVIAICSTQCGMFIYDVLQGCYNRTTEPIQISNSIMFTKGWVADNIYIPPHNSATYLFSSETELLFYGTTRRCRNNKVTALEIVTGKFKKHVDGIPPVNSEQITSTAFTPSYVLFMFPRNGKAVPLYNLTDTPPPNAGGIAVYNYNTESIVWSKQIARIYKLAVCKDLIVTNNQDSYLLLDITDGHLVDYMHYDIDKYPQHLAYLYSYINQENTLTFEQWSDFFDDVSQSPVCQHPYITVIKRKKIFPNVEEKIGKVVVFNYETQEMVWYTEENIVSNVVISNSTVFYLTTANKLIAADLETGEELGFVQFSGGEIKEEYDQGFYVAANHNNQIFVHLGQSNQLFAFTFQRK